MKNSIHQETNFILPTPEERVDLYVAPALRGHSGVTEELPYINTKNVYIDNKWMSKLNSENNFTNYTNNLKKRCFEAGLEKSPILLTIGDVRDAGSRYSISKTRLIDDSSRYTLLKCLNQHRHWVGWLKRPDVLNFSEKKDIAIWRGCSSGGEFKEDLRPANRMELVFKHAKSKNLSIDIGFSNLAQSLSSDGFKNAAKIDTSSDWIKEEFNIEGTIFSYCKGYMLPPFQREYKYILSVDGNDKDSGLNWKLNSNSLVLMAKPQICSWLMEELLVPDYHYVQLKNDFSDLDEKVEWCQNNQDKCEEIINNAHCFMDQFINPKEEINLEIEVIKKHLSNVNYIR